MSTKCSTRKGTDMKRTYFPGLIDVARVSDPTEIRNLLRDNQLDRRFDAHWPLLNGLLLGRLLGVLSFQKKRFPTFRPRDGHDRSSRQDTLWTKLNDRAAALTTANSDVQSLACW